MQGKIATIIPCYNEERRLDPVLFVEYAKEDQNISFYFVDDGSTDCTRNILLEICNQVPDRMNLIELSINKGKAEAVRQGFLHAFDAETFYAIGYFDADLSTPLGEIRNFKKCLDQAHVDLVIGARVMMLGYDIRRSAMRHYLGRLFATAASLVLNIAVYDTQCGAKLFKNNQILKYVFSSPFSVRWTFDVEILARLSLLHQYSGLLPINRCAVEYPLKKWVHIADSKIKAMDFFISFYELFKILVFKKIPIIHPRYRAIHRAYEMAVRIPKAL